jgi:hypothetical protein
MPHDRARARARAAPRRQPNGTRRPPGAVPGFLAGLVTALVVAPSAADSPGEKAAGYPANLALVRAVAEEAVGKMLTDLVPTGPRVRVRVDPYHETGWMVEELVGNGLRARGLTVVSEPAPKPAAPPLNTAGAAAGAPTTPPANAPSLVQLGQQQQQQTQAQADSIARAAAAADSAARVAPAPPGMATPTAPPPALAPEPAKVPVDAEIRLRVVDLGLKYTGSHRTRPFFGEKQISRYAAANLTAELRDPTGNLVQWSGHGEAARIDEVPKDALTILEGQNYPFTPPALPAHSTGKILEPIVVTAVIVGLVFLFVSNRS